MNLLKKKMKTRPFKPAFCLKSAHLQTLFAALFRRQSLPDVEIETFEFDDGDFTECYWHHRPGPGSKKPIVVLFHGLQGSFHSPYIQGIMHALYKAGYSSVLMHFRGCSGRENRLPRSYHSGDTADALAWLKHLKTQYPGSPLYAAGYSLGGNMLLKLLGEQGSDSPLEAAVSISAPLQLEISAKRMEKGFSRLYQNYLLRDLKRALERKYDSHPISELIGLEREAIGKLDTFCAFDDAYTAPIHGFSSADEYYRRSSARQFLKYIEIPTLIIQALDDPFMTEEVLPDASELSDRVALEVYRHGGHVGFVSGNLIDPKYWLEDRIVEFFDNILD